MATPSKGEKKSHSKCTHLVDGVYIKYVCACACEVSLSFISTNNGCSTRAVLVYALMWSPGKSSMVVDELPQQMRLEVKTYLFFLPMLLCVHGKSRDKGQ